MQTCVIFNPAARGDKARQLHSELAGVASEATLKPTRTAGDARRLAAEAVREGFATIVAAGGDGTLNEVLNGIADAGGFRKVRLGVLPLGTVNVFAKELRLPEEFAGAWQVIRAGRDRIIDVPWADFTADGQRQRRHFAQLSGAGLDSRAVELVNWELKKRLGFVSYVIAGFQAFAENLPPIEISDGRQTVRGEMVLLGNGRFYGGRFTLFPQAELADGLLDVVVFPKVNLASLARGGWGMLTDDFHTGGHTVQWRGPSFSLQCAQPVAFQLDGENVGHLPVTFGLEREALRVIAPAA